MAWLKCEHGVFLVNHDKKRVISPPCGLKTCKKCAKRRKKLIVLKIMSHVEDTKDTHQWWFITITPHEKAIWDMWSLKNINTGWTRLRKRLNRRLGKPIYWVATKEFSSGEGAYKRGDEPPPPFCHMHIIIGYPKESESYLTNELKDDARECGIGYMAHVGTKQHKDEPISGVKAMWYIAKYATKVDEEKRLTRAIAWSQNFPELGESAPKSDGWQYLNVSDKGLDEYLRITGYSTSVLKDEA